MKSNNNNIKHCEKTKTRGTSRLLRGQTQQWGVGVEGAVHLQGELELQQLGVAGSSVTEEFGIVWVPLNGLAVMLHG